MAYCEIGAYTQIRETISAFAALVRVADDLVAAEETKGCAELRRRYLSRRR